MNRALVIGIVIMAASAANAQQPRVVECKLDNNGECTIVAHGEDVDIVITNNTAPPPAPLPSPPPAPAPKQEGCPACEAPSAPFQPLPPLRLRHQYDFRPIFGLELGLLHTDSSAVYGVVSFGFRFQRPGAMLGFELKGFGGVGSWHSAAVPVFGARVSGLLNINSRFQLALGLGYFGAQPVDRDNESDINAFVVRPELRINLTRSAAINIFADAGAALTHRKRIKSSGEICYDHQATNALGGGVGFIWTW